MRTLTKRQLSLFQKAVLLFFIVGGLWRSVMMPLDYAAVYWQAGLLIVCILFVFYQLWKQKDYKEIKNRMIRTGVVLLLTALFVWGFKKYYVSPRIEEIKSSSPTK